MTAKHNKLYSIFFISICILISCQQTRNRDTVVNEISKDTATVDANKIVIIKGSEQYPEIYAFVKQLIKQHNLDSFYRLRLEPEIACDLSQDDNKFLKQLLIKKPKKQPAELINNEVDTSSISLDSNSQLQLKPFKFKWDPLPIQVEYTTLEPCLTKKDIQYMRSQKPSLATFRWDVNDLGFDQSNDSNFYSLSIPLFSADHTIAVIMVEDLCKGFLCGTGNSYVYKKKKNKWVLFTQNWGWYH